MPRATRSLHVAAIVTVALAATAFAPVSAPVAAAAAGQPDVRVELTEDGPVRTVAGMSDRLGLAPGESLRDPDARQARVRRLLDLRGHTTVRATDGDCLEECEGATEGPGVPLDTVGGSFATADLDGDGTDDVLVLTETYDADGDVVHGSVEARSGADGSLLWRQEQPGFLAAVPDLDGDGLPDLLAGTFAWEFAEGTTACADPLGLSCDGWSYHVTDTMVLTAFAGASGARLASVEFSSSYEETYRSTSDPLGVVGRDELEVTMQDAIFGLVFLDVDGDGTHELVHDRNDATYRFDGASGSALVAGILAGTEAEDLAAEVVAVDLVTGDATEVRSDDGALLVVDAVDVGAGPRLLLDRFPEFGEATVACGGSVVGGECVEDRSLSGTPAPAVSTRSLHDDDLTPVWEVPRDTTSWFALPVGGDLDGDGVGDLVDLRSDEDSWEDLVTAVSGATGADLWTARTVIAAMSGDAVVAASVRFGGDSDVEEVEVRAQRLDPATGRVLAEGPVASASVEVPEDVEDVFVFGGAGLGLLPLVDGGVDVLGEASMEVMTIDEDCEPSEDPAGGEDCWWGPGEVVASAYELGGVDGRDLQRVLHRSEQTGWLLDVADLDGDAVAELVMLGGDGVGGVVVAERFDGSLLWVLPRDAGYGGLLSTPTGLDVVLDESGRTSVRAGSDLSLRWAVPA